MNKQVLKLVVGPRLKKTMHKFRYVLLLFFVVVVVVVVAVFLCTVVS